MSVLTDGMLRPYWHCVETAALHGPQPPCGENIRGIIVNTEILRTKHQPAEDCELYIEKRR